MIIKAVLHQRLDAASMKNRVGNLICCLGVEPRTLYIEIVLVAWVKYSVFLSVKYFLWFVIDLCRDNECIEGLDLNWIRWNSIYEFLRYLPPIGTQWDDWQRIMDFGCILDFHVGVGFCRMVSEVLPEEIGTEYCWPKCILGGYRKEELIDIWRSWRVGGIRAVFVTFVSFSAGMLTVSTSGVAISTSRIRLRWQAA